MCAPDRIWATGNETSGAWNGTSACTKRITLDETQFLASTPAREHAGELVEALRHMVYLQNGGPSTGIDAMKKLITASTLLSKLDHQNTGETDAD